VIRDLLDALRGPRRRPRVLLVTKRGGCGLCDEAKELLANAAADTPLDLEERAIEDDPALHAAHALEVPVVFIDGEKRFFGKVSPLLLKKALRAAAARPR
jgi:glutaredoxin